MAKKKGVKPPREITKRQLSRWQQQKRRQRIILSLGLFIIAVALGIVGGGWYFNQFRPLHETVIEVNDTKFNMNYYVNMLKYYGQGQPFQYMQYLANEVVTIIEQNELIRQGAMELGITASNREVNEKLKTYEPPLSKDYRDLARTEILLDKLQNEYFEQQIPVFTEQRQLMAMFLESESQATEVRTRLESGEDFADLASELSLEEISKTNKGDLGWKPKGVLDTLLGTSIPEEHAFSAEIGELSLPLYDGEKSKTIGYWLLKVLEKKEKTEKATVQGILLGSAEEAQSVKSRLEAGEDFGELAEELSQHDWSKEDGGDLGWLTPGDMSPAIDEFVFDSTLELETLSEPIRDETIIPEGGYWILKVSERRETPEEAQVQGILLGSAEEAQSVRNRLEAGADFIELAKELSQDEWSKEDGGDLGWLTPGQATLAIDEFIFNSALELETLSEPIGDETVVTNGGYWLVKVSDKEDNREIEDEDRDLLKNKALSEWVSSLWDDPESKVISYLDGEKKLWAIMQATGG